MVRLRRQGLTWMAIALTFGVVGAQLKADAPVPHQVLAQRTVLSGFVQLVNTPPKDKLNFSYAVLYVDNVGRSVTNTLPLRFDLDTTQFPDGPHTLKVVLFDTAGPIATLPQEQVVVANTAQNTTKTPPAKTAQAAPTNRLQVRKQSSTPTIYLDDTPLVFEMAPFIDLGRSMALLRPLLTAAGGTLVWQGNQGEATVNQHRLSFTLNEATALLDGKPIVLARPLTKIQDRIFAPVTLWRDLFACDVEFEAATRSVRLHSLPKPTTPTQ